MTGHADREPLVDSIVRTITYPVDILNIWSMRCQQPQPMDKCTTTGWGDIHKGKFTFPSLTPITLATVLTDSRRAWI